MDIKLKKRIVGILILVAAGIILIPIVFNRSKNVDELRLSANIPTPPAQPAQIQLPAIETPKASSAIKPAPAAPQVSSSNPKIVFEEIAVPNNQNTSSESAAPTAEPLAVKPSAPVAAPVSSTTETENNTTAEIVPLKPATESHTATLQAVPSAEEVPPQLESENTEPAPLVAKPAKPAVVSTTTVQPNSSKTNTPPVSTTKKTSPTPAQSTETWAVQLGVFSDKLNADKLVKKLQAQGYKAYSRAIKTSSGKTITKVLVGPETQRVDAQKIQKELKTISPNAIVVKSGS